MTRPSQDYVRMSLMRFLENYKRTKAAGPSEAFNAALREAVDAEKADLAKGKTVPVPAWALTEIQKNG